uniref:Px2 protein n=1 Tax=Rhizobium leguminosarum bv. viciae TaxID=387 RepID=Q7M1A5_RHILV
VARHIAAANESRRRRCKSSRTSIAGSKVELRLLSRVGALLNFAQKACAEGRGSRRSWMLVSAMGRT